MTASNRTEAALLEQVTDLATLYGWRFCHFRPGRTAHGWRTAMTGAPGFPDLVLVRADRLIFAELKSDDGKATLDQRAWLDELRQTGAEVYLWRPADLEAISVALRFSPPGGSDRAPTRSVLS